MFELHHHVVIAVQYTCMVQFSVLYCTLYLHVCGQPPRSDCITVHNTVRTIYWTLFIEVHPVGIAVQYKITKQCIILYCTLFLHVCGPPQHCNGSTVQIQWSMCCTVHFTCMFVVNHHVLIALQYTILCVQYTEHFSLRSTPLGLQYSTKLLNNALYCTVHYSYMFVLHLNIVLAVQYKFNVQCAVLYTLPACLWSTLL